MCVDCISPPIVYILARGYYWITGFGARTAADNVEFRSLAETVRSSADTRTESALLQH